MLMGTFRALLLSALIAAVGFTHAPLHLSGDSVETADVSPKNNPVDFEVTGIELGNSSLSPRTWVQPDSSTLEYMTKGETIQINVTFNQKGFDPSPITADAKLEIWHPIGIVIFERTFNITLAAGQSVRVPFVWTPSIAHSTLSEDGWLSGGVIFRGTVSAGIGIDGDDSNDLLDRSAPIALWYDPMENGFCNDEAFEGKYCSNTAVPYGFPTWYAAGYSDGYQADSDFPTGTWRMENVSSATGEWHWKVSGANDNYASNRFDRLRWAWQRINSQDGCADGVWGNGYEHGLGYGEHDSTVSAIHVANLCLVKLNAPLLYSVQIATDAWGVMGEGDTIMLETDSGNAGNVEYLNYTAQNISSSDGDWSRLVGNATCLHPHDGFTTSFLFRSDSSFSAEGIHLDSFIIFAIERGEEYTLDADCTFPDNFGGTMEYDPDSEGGNTILVEAADPNPPSLHCHIFNRGYVDTTLWYYTEVSNWSWMSGYPLRIDSNNPIDHDNFVKSTVIKARTYTDTWFNLSIPDGAPVQDLFWYTWINDGIVNKSGDGSGIKYYVELPVSVQSTYRMTLKQKTLANPAATIFPGGTAIIPMDMKNTGNQYSSWNLGGVFPDQQLSSDNLKWYDSSGEEVTVINMTPVEEMTLNAQVSIPEGLAPGLYELDLLANPRQPNTFQASSKVYIEVPVYHDLAIAPVKNAMMAPANGEQNIVQIFLFNYGNTEETFDVRVDTDNWRLMADISSDTVTLEENGGQTTLSLILPMPKGVENGTYRVSIIATSQTDQSYQSMSNFYLTVPKTYLVEVEDIDLSDEVFAAGTDPRTLKWEIWNDGNQDDAYDIVLSFPSDVSAKVEGKTQFRTPYIAPGSSYNLSVSYNFSSGVDGPRTVNLEATSVESGISSEGEARFDVGTVGYLLVLPPSSSTNAMEIRESGDDYVIILPIRSAHPELEQQIRTEVEYIQWKIYDARVAEVDRDFVLQAGETRNVTIHIDVRDEHLEALAENIEQISITLVIISDLDTTSKTTEISLFKPDPVPEGTDVEEVAWKGANYLAIAAGLAVMGAVLLAAFRIFRDARAPLEEFSSLDDYRMTVEGWDGSKVSEGSLPSADDIANSMYGGSQELFEQPPPPSISSPPEDLTSPSSEALGPPVPESGIPEGWTMEQWQHYGQKWLDSQKE